MAAARPRLNDGETQENRQGILNPLQTLLAELKRQQPQAPNAQEVKAAMQAFNAAFEGLKSAPLPAGALPWPDYSGKQFGVDDDFDKDMDHLAANASIYDRINAGNVRVILRNTRELADRTLPPLKRAVEGEPDAEMAGGKRKRSRRRKTKKRLTRRR